MVVKLCLMASHGYPPGLVLHHEQSRILKDSQHLLPSSGAKHEIIRSTSVTMRQNQYEEPLKPMSGLPVSSQFVQIDSTVKKPVLIDMQENRPDSVLFGFGIAEQCTKQEKILKFLMSGPSEVERSEFNMSLLSDLMGLQALTTDLSQQSSTLIYPNGTPLQKPLLDFMGDLACSSKFTVHQDGRVSFAGTGMEVKDLLSFVAEFDISRNPPNWRKLSMLVPQYKWLESNEAVANVQGSSLKLQATTVAPLKRQKGTIQVHMEYARDTPYLEGENDAKNLCQFPYYTVGNGYGSGLLGSPLKYPIPYFIAPHLFPFIIFTFNNFAARTYQNTISTTSSHLINSIIMNIMFSNLFMVPLVPVQTLLTTSLLAMPVWAVQLVHHCALHLHCAIHVLHQCADNIWIGKFKIFAS